MCGIAGIFHYADPDCPVDRDLLVRMTRAIAHRGPDAEDFHVEAGLGLGHRRLSIVDLSPTGAQPMPNDDQSNWITYNGEFYNHKDFRPRLTARGARFRGPSDTETLLRLMELEGPDSLAATAGIFAFAFWDARRKSLTLARDHMGVKQVYFHDDGRRIVFASEIKALLQDPSVPREVDPEAVNQYVHFHTPLFERTFFRGIHVLRAGEYVEFTRYGAKRKTYWALTDFTKLPLKADDAVEELRHELTGIVGRQLMADVPVGAFFSGGIDSSAIAAHAARTGSSPLCFGVHFTNQGVTDERPYQEAAAKALNLDLRLITMDGSDFPDEFKRLTYHQDQPVIGAALFPMAKVSELASASVKVCLGGQAADEVFGGYARYALSHPLQVMQSWFEARKAPAAATDVDSAPEAQVGGNLRQQFAEGGTLSRLARNLRHMTNWETSYFEHFAKVPVSSWEHIFASPDFYSRDRCRQIFHDTVRNSPATDPLDKILHWDVQSYLTGLFQQDDRMSMAASLESRVPFADPRLVQFAFQLRPELKLRAGASKWILRQAVSNVLPPLVLNRRKVGFDTPAESWMRGPHAGFVRDILLSRNARQRGFWNVRSLEGMLDDPNSGHWFDVIWKALSIELWATTFLDTAPQNISISRSHLPEVGLPEVGLPAAGPADQHHHGSLREKATNIVQEFRELGIKGTFARGVWETKTRTGLVRVNAKKNAEPEEYLLPLAEGPRLPFADPAEIRQAISERLTAAQRNRLTEDAAEASKGRIICFSNWMADYGNPIDWHRDPTNGHRWVSDVHWSKALRNAPQVDIKFTWEAGRFPQAYLMARAANVAPEASPILGQAFSSQVMGFIASNPDARGVHWYSGQEVAFRIFAWLFGFHVFSRLGAVDQPLSAAISSGMAIAGSHIAEHIEYARDSVYNNHLLSEALGLYVAGRFTSGPRAATWVAEGLGLLDSQANLQIYPDGSYIQQGHNYHRVAMQLYLWATAFQRANNEHVPGSWLGAMERSLDFLYAHQNGLDGCLPNYGPNDGSKPIPLSGSDLADFRPLLQALSVATRGERLYDAGPADETSLWLFGPGCLDLPLRNRTRTSVSFTHTGHHVMRGKRDGSFGAFRCGTIIDRFSQIDMLHLDVWWRGQNVLVDAGSYRYNGATAWHNHFLRTESHNTVKVDRRDQMVHFRQFKTLFWTQAKLLRFEEHPDWVVTEGEHYGYERDRRCTHRRSVLFVKDDLWVCIDTVVGPGSHQLVLQWLGGEFPFQFDSPASRLSLDTPLGPFSITVLDEHALPSPGSSVAAGQESPPRGWLSRYYGRKTPVPSLEVALNGTLPRTLVSILSGGPDEVHTSLSRESSTSGPGPQWNVKRDGTSVSFRLADGRFVDISVEVGTPVGGGPA